MQAVVPALVAAAASAAVLFLLLRRGSARWLPLDKPNERSLHQQPIPRAGGIAVVLGALAGWAATPQVGWLVPALALGLWTVSLADDLRGLPVAARLGAHVLAALVLVPATFPAATVPWTVLLVLGTVWITNLYNFMDGSDGVAGGMAVCGFCAYGLAAGAADAPALASASFAIAAASAAFLALNLHPARIFLGDSGSIPLGFLAAGLGLQGMAAGAWPLWFPLLVFAPFIGDATVTLLKRLVRRDRVWRAHRDHYYQRMVRMGLGHRRTAYVLYAAMIVCALAALWGREQAVAGQALAFFGPTLGLAALALWTDLKWHRSDAARKGPA